MAGLINTEELQKLLDEGTPGPWELCAHLRHPNENGCTCGYRGVLYGRDDYAICQPGHDVTPGEELLDPPRLPRAEEIANMRLIALAPDLARRVIAAEKLLHDARIRLQFCADLFHDQGAWGHEDACTALMKRISAWESDQ